MPSLKQIPNWVGLKKFLHHIIFSCINVAVIQITAFQLSREPKENNMRMKDKLATSLLCGILLLLGTASIAAAQQKDPAFALQRGYRTGYSDGYMAGYANTPDLVFTNPAAGTVSVTKTSIWGNRASTSYDDVSGDLIDVG